MEDDQNVNDQNQQKPVNQNVNDQGNFGNTGDQNQQQNSGKIFTQDDVNAIGAREKRQGKKAILELFGCTDEKAATAAAEEFKKWRESQKTEEQKRSEAEQQLLSSIKETEKRAAAAENKLSAIAAGVTSDSLDDALALALPKVTEEKSLDKVFAEMKKDPKYSGFFSTGSAGKGTGTTPDHNSHQGGQENIGKRLAEKKTTSLPKQSNFFTKI